MIKDKIRGSLIGSAIGDGFGYPTEFMDLNQIKEKWGKQGLVEPIGDIIKVTDDTQMAISVAKSIMRSYKSNSLNKELFESTLIEEFITWLNDKENNRAPGMTCINSCEKLEKGMNWEEATAKNSKGCGANMRVLPIGLLKFKNKKITNSEISKWSQYQSVITHGHQTALVASELTAITVVKILEGIHPNELVDDLINYCKSQLGMYHADYLKNIWQRPGIISKEDFINRGWEDCLLVLQRVKSGLLNQDKIEDPCDTTGEGWIAEEAFGTALLCFLMYPNDSKKVLIRAVNTRGDSDSLACIAGAFVGAYNGIDSFPEDWVNRIEYKKELNEYLDFLERG